MSKTFKSEQEKIEAIKALRDDESKTQEEILELIDQYQRAEIVPEGTEENNTNTGENHQSEEDDQKKEPQPSEEDQQQQQPEKKENQRPEDMDSWNLDGVSVTIPKDGYKDDQGNFYRYFTFKTVQDAFNSIPHAQRTIAGQREQLQKLQQKLNEEKQTDSTKDQKIQELEQEVQNLKQQVSQKDSAQGNSEESLKKELQEVKKSLEELDPNDFDYDATEHGKLLQKKEKLLDQLSEVKQSNNQTSQPKDYQKSESQQKQEPSQQQQQSQQSQPMPGGKIPPTEIDNFVKGHAEELGLKNTDKTGSKILNEGFEFEDTIAAMFSGKDKKDLTMQDINSALSAYRSGHAQLVNAVPMPETYNAFKNIEKVYNARVGYKQDPTTGNIVKNLDNNQMPILPGSMENAYMMLKNTGDINVQPVQSQQPQKKTQNTEEFAQMADAINQRDQNITSMDASTAPKDSGDQMTTDRAQEIMRTIDATEAIQESNKGNHEVLNLYNKALAKLGFNPIGETAQDIV